MLRSLVQNIFLCLGIIKRRLYNIMRTDNRFDWPNLMPAVVDAINRRPVYGDYFPAQAKSRLDDLKILNAKSKALKYDWKSDEFNWRSWRENQEKFDKSRARLKPGAFVYVTRSKSFKDKSFNDQTKGQIFIIQRVDARYANQPHLYVLVDLKKDRIPGYFYAKELIWSPEPNWKTFWKIQSVNKNRPKVIDGVPHYEVKFRNYPSKFNLFLTESEIVKGKFDKH